MARQGQVLAAGLLGLVAASAGSACVALWGVDALRYEDSGHGGAAGDGSGGLGGGAGGSTTSSSGGGTTGGGGTGGTSTCSQPDCASCVVDNCALSGCGTDVQPCIQNSACVELSTCSGACPTGDADCASDCMTQHPNGVVDYIPARACVMCSQATCGPLCEAECAGCAQGSDCTTCINSNCATTACNTSVGACLGDADCTAYLSCINGCNGDESCMTDCAASNPPGATLYERMLLCLSCHPMTCGGVCQIPVETCAAWAGAL